MDSNSTSTTENNQVVDNLAGGRKVQQGWGHKPFFRSLRRPKQCVFCVDSSKKMGLKDPSKLYRFISDRSKILSRRVTGLCAYHQRAVAQQIKVARFLSLIR